MPKVRVKEVYFDKVRDEYPEEGAEFDVEEKRADVLVKAGVCELVTEEQNNANAPVKEPKKNNKESKKAETK